MLQTEEFSLLEIKLPQYFPGGYSQHSLIKAVTQSRVKHYRYMSRVIFLMDFLWHIFSYRNQVRFVTPY